MKVSLHWLSEWIDVGTDVPALAQALTMAGLEVEAIMSAAPVSTKVVVGEVLSVVKHPQADKLSVCQVDIGTHTTQIVCGAKNVRAGLKAPCALLGAQLVNGVEIKQVTLRGVESSGMLCSAKELGLAEDSAGLLELPVNAVAGQDIATALALDDQVLEINLTPNRGDCMSVLGVARELAALRGAVLRGPQFVAIPAVISDQFPVRIETATGTRFVSRVIRNVRGDCVAPMWLRERLRRAGVRSVNAIVDVTNYVMLELGQPMHAYDLAILHDGINVRTARPNETLKLLDGRTIELSPDVLVIADAQAALALAGVMGGMDSAITTDTQDILLEVAFFTPSAIAGRGRRYGLVTDAAQRFERGVDPTQQVRAIERATQLLLDCVGGRPGPVTQSANEIAPHCAPIRLRYSRCIRVLGHAIPVVTVESLLQALGITLQLETTHENTPVWRATPPSWRFDLAIEEDLIEEIARLYGYDHIPAMAATAEQIILPLAEQRVTTERLASVLVDRGYQETISYSFTDPALQQLLFPHDDALTIANPISAELAVMRLSLWPGLLQVLRTNQHRQQASVRIFEVGRSFLSSGNTEKDVIAGLAGGAWKLKQWADTNAAIDFFDVKGDLEALLQLTGTPLNFKFVAAQHPALHPGQTARVYVGEQPIGWIGALHPKWVNQLGLTFTAVMFELELAALIPQLPSYREFSRFPAIRRDLAMVVDATVEFAAVRTAVQSSAGIWLKDVRIFDVYLGEEIGAGKKSLALSLTLQDTARTLTDEDADTTLQQVVVQLQHTFAAKIRD